MNYFLLFLLSLGWVALIIHFLAVRYGWWKKLAKAMFKSWYEVPWASVRSFNVIGDTHGNNDIHFVSRHDIAECGLTCPNCGAIAAERGDFTGVRRALVNGTENEVVKCLGRVFAEMEDHPCPAWLAASPTTEHGDHLDAEGNVSTDASCDSPEFYKFKRAEPETVLREKYGLDLALPEEGVGMKIAEGSIVPIKPTNKHDVLMGEELHRAVQAELLRLDSIVPDPVKTDSDATPANGTPVDKKGPYV